MAENVKKKISRRSFLDRLITGSVFVSAIAVLGSVLTYIYPPKEEGGAEAVQRVRVATLEELPVGKAKPVVFQGVNVIVMHVKLGLFAVDMKCTHLGCMVEWEESPQVLKCPCHAAFFDYQGKIISGPAPKPLPAYKVEVVNEIIYVTGLA